MTKKSGHRKKIASKPKNAQNSKKPKNPKYVHDSYTQRAQREGYKARSVFKLSEMERQHKLLTPEPANSNANGKFRVLELGAAPGSWSRYILQHFGRDSRLYAVDLQPLAEEFVKHPQLHFFQGDFCCKELQEQIRRALDAERFDFILSDMAPNTSGNRTVDTGRSEALAEAMLAVLPQFLRLGGNFLFKLFQGGSEQDLQLRLRRSFASCQRLKPQAVRSQSFEIYFLCKDYKG